MTKEEEEEGFSNRGFTNYVIICPSRLADLGALSMTVLVVNGYLFVAYLVLLAWRPCIAALLCLV